MATKKQLKKQPERQEEMYDFGALGKFSESTIKENIEFYTFSVYYGMPAIEKYYNKLIEDIERDKYEYGDKKLSKIKDVSELCMYIKYYNVSIEREERLQSSFLYYRKVCKEIYHKYNKEK